MMNCKKLKNQNGVSTLVLIIILLIAVVAIGGIIYYFFFMNKPTTSVGNNPVNSNAPVLALEYSDDGESLDVIVKITATTNDAGGIKSIVLPNKEEVTDTEYEYKISKNGTYTFKAVGNNGETTTEEVEIKNIPKPSATKPYIPEGFTVILDDVETGFVIQDKFENEFVWIPVETGYLTRTTNFNVDYQENSTNSSEFYNSVSKYYGFYIGRYEASKSTGNRVLEMKSQDPWVNISFTEADNYARNMSVDYKYDEKTKTCILSSYAWDTVLEFMNTKVDSFSTSTQYGNYDKLAKTGETDSDCVYNIYDIAGNAREWTSEIYNNPNPQTPAPTPTPNANSVNTTSTTDYSTTLGRQYRVIRGGGSGLARTPAARTDTLESESSGTWGFRVVLYKVN